MSALISTREVAGLLFRLAQFLEAAAWQRGAEALDEDEGGRLHEDAKTVRELANRLHVAKAPINLAGDWPSWRIEELAAKVHERWMEAKRAQGVMSRKSEQGEELMVPYEKLSGAAKELDRTAVRAVLEVL